jgi:hypothetical protein
VVSEVHWLPRPLNEDPRSACGIDVTQHPLVEWRSAQNEATCLSCLNHQAGGGDDDAR